VLVAEMMMMVIGMVMVLLMLLYLLLLLGKRMFKCDEQNKLFLHEVIFNVHCPC
jgi:cytochrome bd-type quinol oxidase subunit 1